MDRARATSMRVTAKGQVTIPKALRYELGIGPGGLVELKRDGDTIVMGKAAGSSPARQIVERLRGRGDSAMTTDEIVALTRGD